MPPRKRYLKKSKEVKQKKVIVEFVFDEVKDKEDDYYRDKAFDAIYNNGYDCIDLSHAEVVDIR